MKLLIALSFLLFVGDMYSQTTTSVVSKVSTTVSVNYKKADSIALNFQRNKYYFYVETAQELAESFNNETERCRAIFRWIANNIKYDFDVMNSKNCEDPQVVYKRKKAVCGGYSALFKAMCDEAKIECKIIIGQASCTDNCWHAWNIVRLEGEWYAMDVTWASGHLTNALKGTVKKAFDNDYWMADYKLISKDHWTKDSDWERYIVSKYDSTQKNLKED